MNDLKKLTNEVGAPVADNENSITAGPRGPVIMQDVWLLEKLAHFDREVIPERRMHAKGWGAYGKLTVTHDISKYTRAKVLQPGAVTDCFVRFSTVAGERGAADAERDIRGVAIKFYTPDGNWDLVGNNTPTFFIRDVHNFPDLNRAVKRDPLHRHALRPEQLGFLDAAAGVLPPDHRGHVRPRHPRVLPPHAPSSASTPSPSTTTRTSASGASSTSRPAGHQEPLQRGGRPSTAWTARAPAAISTTPLSGAISQVDHVRADHDRGAGQKPLRKPLRHHQDLAPRRISADRGGRAELNRWPDNYFAEVEQAAFTPAHVVPGIGFSPDKFLQGRLFVYGDAQRYRLGVNHNLIPVNQAKGVAGGPADYHRDGHAHRRQLRRRARLYPQQRRILDGPAGGHGAAARA
jgi:catalase